MTDLRAVARALGGEIVSGQVVAPGPGHSAKDRSMSVRLSAGAPDGFLAFSHAGDDWRACRDHVRACLGLTGESRRRQGPRRPNAPAKPVDRFDDVDKQLERELASARRIASEIVPLIGTPGEAYLRDVRKIDVAPLGDVLSRTEAIGWNSAVYFNHPGHPLHAQRLGCVIGIMTDVKAAQPTGAISRTFLGPDLKKIGKAKTLGQPQGIVRLSPDDEVLEGLLLGEGLETALAGMSIGLRPMWSTGSTALMRSFPLLSDIQAITVVVDHDLSGAGERAARELEARWRAARREVTLLRSDALGDLNDALKGIVR